ncbi:hypothetical protein HER10_EVM0011393 [Colletotrichum scovillei]|uniref:uncharacterized protein n=1 Tax=Colletotrichum scovillei TaxID=1209932 RepID=UPI0015C2E91C|nr:uncharacterized protein HER10_EVM0011393 [Colletotrichum scovillei]KAF4783568.1 hypothetical protein HER10_EVM0011393 [Colletotrichum scovillei]
MSDEHLQEVNDPHRSPWSSVTRRLYLNNCEARVEILKEIKRMTYLDGDTTSSLSDDLHTPYLWAACMSTDLSELENFRDTLKESSMEDAGPSLMQISAAVQQLIAFCNAKSPRRETATRSSGSTTMKSSNSPRPLLSPVQNSPGKAGSGGRQQSAQSSLPSSSGNQEKYRNERAVHMAKQRDNGTCPLLGTRYCEAAQIYPFASIEKKGMVVTSVHALIKVFGRGTAQRFTDAPRMVDLDSCANLICLDRIPHRMFDDGRLALQPIDRGTRPSSDHFIRLRVHLLQRQHEPRAWRSDLAQDPYELLRDFQLVDDEPQEIRLVSSMTQREISDGHEFDITAKTQKDLPNWNLLDLRYRISLMNHLIRVAGVSDEDIDESDEDVSDEELEDIDVIEGAISKREEIAEQRSKEVDEDNAA